MIAHDTFVLFDRRWPPVLALHKALVRRYLAFLQGQGFGLRQTLFISANIAAFLEFLHHKNKQLTDVSRQDVDVYFHHAPYNLQTDNGKARRTYLLRFLAFASPERAGDFQRPPRFGPPTRPFGDIGQDFLDFGRQHRGLKDSTLKSYRALLASFEAFLVQRNSHDLRRLSLAAVDTFFMAHTIQQAPSAQNSVVGMLRNFLRFLYLNRVLQNNLAPRLMRPSLFRRNLRPKFLLWGRVERFLASIDRTTPLGKRDYAISLLMATLGLRPRELVLLRVRDVDLERQTLFLPERKGGRPDLFPLSSALVNVLRDYLAVRPSAPFEELFLSVRPPVKPLGREVRTTVAIRMARHFGRSRSMRVYLLRHSFAKRLLDNGAPLPDIGQILGHRSLSSTLIYTQVDVKSLREVADNYADLLPTPPA